MTGQPKTSFNSLKTAGGKDAEEDRRNRNPKALAASGCFCALSKMVWCMVGTPEYHEIFSSLASSRNFRALNQLEQQTEAP